MTESLLLTSLFHSGIYLKIAITKGRVCAGRVISYGEKDKFFFFFLRRINLKGQEETFSFDTLSGYFKYEHFKSIVSELNCLKNKSSKLVTP